MTITASPTLRPVTIDYGTGPDTLVLNIAQDAFLGNAQYQVFVDGKRVGGTFTASALNSLGQTDSLTLRGDWGPGAHSVSVKFVNDLQVAGEGDRNLFVRGVSFNGDTIPQASANLWSGNSAGEFRTILRPVNGALSYGSGPDAVTLSIAQDYYQANAQYQVLVDGKPIDAIFAANAQRKAGQTDIITIRGDFGPGQHEIAVKYLNDKSDSGGDRNLFINSIAFNGNTIANSAKNLWQSGSYSVATPIAPDKGAIDYGSGPDTLVLKINQDAYAGNAQYIVTVDGKQVGGLFEASASRRAGETDTVTLHGNWGSGAHDIKVTYLNDFRDAVTGGDRNMYVAGATYNGATIADARGNLWSAGSVGFSTPANLVGTGGADKLAGGKGNDILRGGLGADTLTGGAGSDLFIHAKGDDKDTITDFTVSGAEADRIDLSRYGFASFDHIKSHLVQKGADTLLTLNATDSILLKNVVASTLTAANFSFSDVKAANTSGFDVGVNLTGPEYIAPANAPSGWISGDGLFPTTADLEYFAAKGMGTIRLALAWETLQPSLNGAFNADYLAKIESVVTQSKALGIDVILDIHNYGSYNGNLIGTSAVPTSAFTDLWSKLAGKFANADNVKFDLMNEPQQATAAEWLGIANKAIAAIRATGATQEILVPGVHWQAGFNWVHTDNATAFAKPGAIVDPLNNFAIQIHQYLDPTTAGTSDQAVSATIGVERLTAVTDWARTYNYKLYLGETGVGDNALGLTALDNMMAFLKSNQDVWTGVAYFAAGQGFAPDYMYSIQPENGVFDTPQMDVLEKFIDVKTVKTAQADGSTRIDTFGHGSDHASITDVVNANGTLVSRSVYTANGTLTSAVALKADDTFLFDDFDGTSGKKTHEALIKTVQGATKTLADTTWAADGSFVSRTFDETTGNVARLENHDAAGRLTFMQENTATAHSRTQYLNGVIQSSSTIDIYGNLIEAFTYNTSGALVQHDSLDSRGYHIVEQYDPSTGRNTARGDFNANWQMQSWTSFEADGSRMITLMHADGSKQIDYYASHATSAYKVDQFGIDGHYIGTQMLSGMI